MNEKQYIDDKIKAIVDISNVFTDDFPCISIINKPASPETADVSPGIKLKVILEKNIPNRKATPRKSNDFMFMIGCF